MGSNFFSNTDVNGSKNYFFILSAGRQLRQPGCDFVSRDEAVVPD